MGRHRPASRLQAHLVSRLGAVERLFDGRWDGSDLGAQLLFDAVQIEPVVIGDEVDGKAQVAKSAGAAHSVKVGLGILGEVEIDDHIDCLDVNASREQI